MADNAKNTPVTIEDITKIIADLNNKTTLQSAMAADENIIYQRQATLSSSLKNSISDTENRIDKLDMKLANLGMNLDKLTKAMSLTEENFGKSSEQFLDVAESFKKVKSISDETFNQLQAWEKALDSFQTYSHFIEERFKEAEKKYQQDKIEIVQTMSDLIKGNSDAITRSRQNYVHLRDLAQSNPFDYGEDAEKAEAEYRAQLEEQRRLESIQDKYRKTNERISIRNRASRQYLEDKRDLDMQKEAGAISDENYKLRLSELKEVLGDKANLSALTGGKIDSLLEGKSLKEILNSGIQGALSLSPVGQAVLAISSYVGKIFSLLNSGVQASANMASQYLGKIDARLQGSMLMDSSGKGEGIYQRINRDLVERFVASPFVNQKQLMQSISQFVDAGTTWNVEQRALIATLSDKMVSTFDALDASLTRLIRIQGADLTMTSMGAEAQLTKFLNRNFEDTSYLTSLYDTVNSAVLDASAQLNYEGAIGFNYAVQKWLGSLYSVGMSESGVSTIAQGLNYLATGNAEALAGNSSLQNLLALSATNAGLNYAELLKTGLNADNTDLLLESMVRYLQGIYSNINNNVVKSAWSGISGLSVTDLRAISNLSQTEISNIASSDITYGSALTEFQNQLYSVEERTSVQDYATNLMDNILLNVGNTILGMNDVGTFNADGLKTYLTWQLGEKIGGLGGTLVQGLSILGSIFGGSDDESYDIKDLVLSFVDSVKGGSINPTKGFEYIWNPSNFESGLFGSQLTLKDRALNYVPLLAAMASSPNLVSSGTDLGISSVGALGAAIGAQALSGFSEGTSFAVTNATSSSDRSLSLSNNDLVTAEAAMITGSESELETKTVYDLYVKLFEQRDVPIRVQLAEFEELAAQSLKDGVMGDLAGDVKYLANQAAGSGINVDLGAEDASVMTNQIYRVKNL